MKSFKKRNLQKGMTVLEFVLLIAIIGILGLYVYSNTGLKKYFKINQDVSSQSEG